MGLQELCSLASGLTDYELNRNFKEPINLGRHVRKLILRCCHFTPSKASPSAARWQLETKSNNAQWQSYGSCPFWLTWAAGLDCDWHPWLLRVCRPVDYWSWELGMKLLHFSRNNNLQGREKRENMKTPIRHMWLPWWVGHPHII